MSDFLKFFPLVKVDIENRLVYGLVTAESEDKDGEVCHYDSTKPEYKAVNDELGKASDGANIMPLREMHQLKAVGAGKSIDFDDQRRQIRMCFKVVDNDAWKKVTEKVLLGFSQGGKYLKQWSENGKRYYTARPSEVSLVDNPCLPGAFIEYAKADGTVELFKTPEVKLTEADVDRIVKALETSLAKGVKLSDADLDTLRASGKALIDEIIKTSQLTGAEPIMNPEELKKCAAALGITEEELSKRLTVEKAKHSMAALHGHLEKAHSHHSEMAAHHNKMTAMHEAHAGMLQKCMKACKGVMGSEEEAEKAIKALKDELDAIAKAAGAPPANDDHKKTAAPTAEDITKMVDDRLKDVLKAADPETLKKFGVTLVPRPVEPPKTTAAQDSAASIV